MILNKKHPSSLFLCTVTELQAPYKTHPSFLTSPLTHLSAYPTQRVFSINVHKVLRYYGEVQQDIADAVVNVAYPDFMHSKFVFPTPVLFLNVCNL